MRGGQRGFDQDQVADVELPGVYRVAMPVGPAALHLQIAVEVRRALAEQPAAGEADAEFAAASDVDRDGYVTCGFCAHGRCAAEAERVFDARVEHAVILGGRSLLEL